MDGNNQYQPFQKHTKRQVRSMTITLAVGTWKAMQVIFLIRSGMALPAALAAPAESGMSSGCSDAMDCGHESFHNTKLSWMTLGAEQLVVQEALLRNLRLLSYFLWFTPITNMRASAEGAEMMIRLTSPCKSVSQICTQEDEQG
ncbi:hypothetical protein AAY473_013879 [Plecturocebus cupreus]